MGEDLRDVKYGEEMDFRLGKEGGRARREGTAMPDAKGEGVDNDS
jgi:hypothetical protein